MAPEALSVLIPEERHQFYKMLRLKSRLFLTARLKYDYRYEQERFVYPQKNSTLF